jgi:hypothetical protein
MRDRQLRAMLRRLGDAALLVAFLALTIFAYGVFFVGASRMLISPVPQFSNFYQMGQNPWAGALTQPASQQQVASTGRRSR